MIFLERKHYCTSCKKEVFLFKLFTRKKDIVEKHDCPVCSNELVSYWYEYPRFYIIPMIASSAFFMFAVIYSLLRFSQGIKESVDIFIAISNTIFGGLVELYASTNRKKVTPPEKEDNSIGKLSIFRKQFIDVLFIIFVSFAMISALNGLIWIIWKNIQ
ncbi:MAG: hypothetical protein ACTSRR_06815 [Candidatus Heimdallarchaeaceae archaeon]